MAKQMKLDLFGTQDGDAPAMDTAKRKRRRPTMSIAEFVDGLYLNTLGKQPRTFNGGGFYGYKDVPELRAWQERMRQKYCR